MDEKGTFVGEPMTANEVLRMAYEAQQNMKKIEDAKKQHNENANYAQDGRNFIGGIIRRKK